MTTCRLVGCYQQIEGWKDRRQPTQFCNFSFPTRQRLGPLLAENSPPDICSSWFCEARTFTIYTNILSLNNSLSVHVRVYSDHFICVCSQHLQLSFSYFTVLKNMNGPENWGPTFLSRILSDTSMTFVEELAQWTLKNIHVICTVLVSSLANDAVHFRVPKGC